MAVEATPLLDGATCVGAVLVVHRQRSAELTLDFEALAAGLAHEIKNPLAGLQGSAELLAREAEGAAREYAQVIARGRRRGSTAWCGSSSTWRARRRCRTAPVGIHTVLGDVLGAGARLPGGGPDHLRRALRPLLPTVHWR